MAKKKKSRKSRKSSGLRKAQNANSRVQRLQMKVRRWKRYISEIESGRRRGNIARWNTTRMEKHIVFLKKVA